MLDSTNQLRESWDTYTVRQVRKLCKGIAKEQRAELREVLVASAAFNPIKNEKAYKEALKLLK